MKDNLSRAGLTLLIIICPVLSVAYVKNLADNQVVKIIHVPDPNHIPSARQIQQSLKDLGDPRYDPGPIDGIPGPKMIKGWDNYICDRYAKRSIEGR